MPFAAFASQEFDSTMSARPRFGNEPRSDSRIEQLRVPPQSVEAEQAVLGGLMLAPDAYDRIADHLVDGDFYRRDHQLIYRAIRELAEKNRPYDAVTLGEWFESQGLAEQVAGGAYLVELASTTPSAANIAAYAEIVRDKAVLRQLIEVGTGIVNDGFQPEGRESSEILASARSEEHTSELQSLMRISYAVFCLKKKKKPKHKHTIKTTYQQKRTHPNKLRIKKQLKHKHTITTPHI